MKMVIPIPLKEIQKTTPHAQSVALNMVIVWRNGFAVMGVACGTTKSVQTLRKECQRCFIVKVVLYIINFDGCTSIS